MTVLAILNAIVCAAIALRLLAYRRHGSQHRPRAAWLAYLLIVATASVPLRVLLGVPVSADLTTVALNLVLAAAVFAVRGNVSDLFRHPPTWRRTDKDHPIAHFVRKPQ